jgi:hypothetical protein
MKRYALIALALAFGACATVNDTNFNPGRVVISSTYDLPTCATAASVGELCASGDIETNANIDVAGTSTLTGAVSTGALTAASAAITAGATVGTTLAVTGASTLTGAVTLNSIVPYNTVIDFTKEKWVPFFAKTTGAIMTEADTQEDFFYVGSPKRYFEIFQDGNNTDNAGPWVVGATGWVMPGPDATDQGTQLTEGIILGSAKSYTAGTDAAVLKVAFYIPTRDQIAELFVGFRILGAYAVADDATELKTAYTEKAVVGIEAASGVLNMYVSKNNADSGPTACTHAAAADGDILAIEATLSAANRVTYKIGTATPAGTTAAEIRAGVTAAYADLTADVLCAPAAVTLTAATEVVPTIMWATANGTGAWTTTLVDYYSSGN